MKRLFILFALVCLHVYALPLERDEDNEEVNIDTSKNDEVIDSMYAKEIEEGDNAEQEIVPEVKHHKANKKHFHAHHGYQSHVGLPINDGIYHHGAHHFGHAGLGHAGVGLGHGDFGHPAIHIHGGHHGHVGHHLPGHGAPLPIIFPDHHHHHDHNDHHHMHMHHALAPCHTSPCHDTMHHAPHHGFPEYMTLPYAMPMCVMEKDDKKKDDKKKDDKKKDDKKKTRRQLVPCHLYGPPSAGWGAYSPGWTGSGWGAPYWY